MRFPQYNYQEYNNNNTDSHPLPWCEMLNGSIKYCEALTDVFEFEDHCRACDLPSEHPYWKLETFRRTLDLIDFTRGFISQTKLFIKNNPSNRYVNNAYGAISQQEQTVRELCKSIR